MLELARWARLMGDGRWVMGDGDGDVDAVRSGK